MASATVALVVDVGESLASVRRVCETAGFVMIHTHDVATARTYVERYTPAVTIMSCTPSDRDGLAWIAELRRTLPDALIIVVGDKDDPSVLDAGADVVLEPPIDEHVLATTLQPLLAVDRDAVASVRLKLVVVEPDERLAKVMQRWLGKAFEISLAANGWRAIEEIRHRRPDVVLAELRLPDMDAT
jgi:DNA-binding response OmpR family regulator